MIRTSMLSLAGMLAFGLVCFVMANDSSAQCCNSYSTPSYSYNNGCNTGCNTGRSWAPRRVVLRPRNNNCGTYTSTCGNTCGNSYSSGCNSCGTSYSSCNTGCNTGCNSCGSNYASYTPSYNHNSGCNSCGGNYVSTPVYNSGCNSCGGSYGYSQPVYNNGCGCGNMNMTYSSGQVVSGGCYGCQNQVMSGTISGGTTTMDNGTIVPQPESVETTNDAEVATPPNPDET